jgi:hypothetical protein
MQCRKKLLYLKITENCKYYFKNLCHRRLITHLIIIIIKLIKEKYETLIPSYIFQRHAIDTFGLINCSGMSFISELCRRIRGISATLLFNDCRVKRRRKNQPRFRSTWDLQSCNVYSMQFSMLMRTRHLATYFIKIFLFLRLQRLYEACVYSTIYGLANYLHFFYIRGYKQPKGYKLNRKQLSECLYMPECVKIYRLRKATAKWNRVESLHNYI